MGQKRDNMYKLYHICVKAFLYFFGTFLYLSKIFQNHKCLHLFGNRGIMLTTGLMTDFQTLKNKRCPLLSTVSTTVGPSQQEDLHLGPWFCWWGCHHCTTAMTPPTNKTTDQATEILPSSHKVSRHSRET
jgi:hypothetical protein